MAENGGHLQGSKRRGDDVPLLVKGADGLRVVMHSPEEFARFWRGVALGPTERLSEESSS